MAAIDRRHALLMGIAAALPLPAAARSLRDYRPQPAHLTEPIRVLVIESDRPTECAVELALQTEGMLVWTTDLGEEGADLAVKYDYDVIVVASHMVDITGVAVLKTIRAAGVGVPVVYVSQHFGPDERELALSSGASAVLFKPARNHELISQVTALVRPSIWVRKPQSLV